MMKIGKVGTNGTLSRSGRRALSLCVATKKLNSTWFYGTYALDDGPRMTSPGNTRTCPTNGWCIGGPFVGFKIMQPHSLTT